MTANLGLLNGLPGTRDAANLGLLNGLAVTNVPTPIVLPSSVDSGAQAFVALTGDTTAHVKGAWSELLVTTADANCLYVQAHANPNNTQNTQMLLDIGTGAASTERVVIQDLNIGYAVDSGVPSARFPWSFLIPLTVASGTRIAGRIQSATVTAGPTARQGRVRIGTMRLSNALSVPTELDTIGANTAATRGTSVSTSFTQLTPGTKRAYQALIVNVGGTGDVLGTGTSTCTVASGAAGSEVPLISLSATSSTSEAITQGNPAQPFTIYTGHIPSGTRLSARFSASTSVTDVTLYGVPYA